MWERYPPTPPSNCGENEIQVSLISSTSVGATPTPATNLGRCSGCRSVKPVSQTTVGSDDWSITSTSHQPSRAIERMVKVAHHCSSDGGPDFTCLGFGLAGHFGLVAQSAERPVVCGRVEGATPFGSAILSERSSVFRAPGLGPGGRRCNSCHPDHCWKAGRYKLAAPVSKTGSASPRSEHYRRLPPILCKPRNQAAHISPRT